MPVHANQLTIPRIGAAALVLIAFGYPAVPAERQQSKSDESEEVRQTKGLIEAELPRWRIGLGANAAELQLSPKPILRWTNPATGRMYGEIYLWISKGRPEAVMSLYKVWEPAWGFAGELHSLSLTNLAAERDTSIAWKCDEAGITFHDVPDAPPTAETASRRMRQMVGMANDFAAVLMDYRNNDKGERQALRLLTSAVYRYSSPDRDVTDGAIFAFVLGTDAEVLLLLEARGAKDANRWQYALARLNSDELAAFWNGKEVWRVGKATYNERHKPYAFMSLPESPPQE